jgi:hypothetical protein
MRSREGVMKSKAFSRKFRPLFPVIEEGGSDSFGPSIMSGNAFYRTWWNVLPRLMMMIPEAGNEKIFSWKKKSVLRVFCLSHGALGWTCLFTFSDETLYIPFLIDYSHSSILGATLVQLWMKWIETVSFFTLQIMMSWFVLGVRWVPSNW